ncbi:VAMP-like protein YKT62 [Iris pallida]|uniref:VAMP-like protein YKT62 n=1 Tax=Iris pallida TaxID=29817 RepID=A0AAX6DYK7_IRIPA|nr:VAMP-like protein YKT62 [Iris pallida]
MDMYTGPVQRVGLSYSELDLVVPCHRLQKKISKNLMASGVGSDVEVSCSNGITELGFRVPPLELLESFPVGTQNMDLVN